MCVLEGGVYGKYLHLPLTVDGNLKLGGRGIEQNTYKREKELMKMDNDLVNAGSRAGSRRG